MKKLIVLLCVLISLFAVGCSSDISDNQTSTETKTNSTADDSKYYDKKTGKIILTPVKDEEKKKEEAEQVANAPKTEKADFSGQGEREVEQAKGKTWMGENNKHISWKNARPETIAGFISIAALHHSMFPNDIFKVTDGAATEGHSPGSLHYAGLAVDAYSDKLIPAPEMGVYQHWNTKCGTEAAYLNSPEYADVHANRHKFISLVQSLGIRVLDEYEHPVSYTTGPHLHFEFGNFKGGGILFNLFDGLKNIGDVLSVLINRFTDMGKKAYTALFPNVAPLVWVLAVIDIALAMILAGFDFRGGQLLFEIVVPRIIKYTAIYGVIVIWPTLVNAILQTINFVNEVGFPNIVDTVNQNVSQPQLIMQKGFDLIRPGLDFISMVTFDQFIASLIPCLLILVSALVAMAALMAIALYVTVLYVEFFIGAGLSIIMLPFGATRFLKFLAEGAGSWMVNCGIRLMTLSFVFGMTIECAFKSMTNKEMVKIFGNLTNVFQNQPWYETIFKTTVIGKLAEAAKTKIQEIYSGGNVMTIDEQLMAAVATYMTMCAVICALCYLIYRCTESIANWLQGSFSIPEN